MGKERFAWNKYTIVSLLFALVMFQCSKSDDVATTIVLAKAKIGEYYEVQKQIQTIQQNPAKQNLLAELKIKSGSLLSDAKTMLEQAQIMDSDTPEGIFLYLDVLELHGDHDLVVEEIERLIKRNRNYGAEGDLWVRLGINYMKKGPDWLDESFQCLGKAVKLKVSEKEYVRMWQCFGDIYWELRLLGPAEESYKKASERGSDLWSKVGLAGIDVARGNMSSAEKTLTGLGKELQVYDVPVRLRMREALTIFEETVKNINNTPDEYLAYSHILYRAGRVEDSIATANHALYLNEKLWEGWNYLGSVYLQLGYIKDAETAFSKSLQQNSDQPNIKSVMDEISKMRQIPKERGKTSQPLIFKND